MKPSEDAFQGRLGRCSLSNAAERMRNVPWVRHVESICYHDWSSFDGMLEAKPSLEWVGDSMKGDLLETEYSFK